MFNDANDFPDNTNNGIPDGRADIRRVCKRLNIPCVDLVNDHHRWRPDASDRCADSMNAMFDVQCKDAGRYLTLDSDVLPITSMDVNMYTDWDCAFVPHSRVLAGHRVEYMWPGLVYMNMARVSPKSYLRWECIPGLDCGGATTRFLATTSNSQHRLASLNSGTWSSEHYPDHLDRRWLDYAVEDVRSAPGKLWPDLFDGRFMHFRAGSNWDGRPQHELQARIAKLEDVVLAVCRG